MILLWVRVDLGVMAIKGHTVFPKASALLEPYHQIFLYHIQDTRWGSFTRLLRCSQCILQPQLTGTCPIRVNCLWVVLVVFLMIFSPLFSILSLFMSGTCMCVSFVINVFARILSMCMWGSSMDVRINPTSLSPFWFSRSSLAFALGVYVHIYIYIYIYICTHA